MKIENGSNGTREVKVKMQVLKNFGNLSGRKKGIGELEEANIQALTIQKEASKNPDANGQLTKTIVVPDDLTTLSLIDRIHLS